MQTDDKAGVAFAGQKNRLFLNLKLVPFKNMINPNLSAMFLVQKIMSAFTSAVYTNAPDYF